MVPGIKTSQHCDKNASKEYDLKVAKMFLQELNLYPINPL